METTKTTLTEKIIIGLREAATKLEELRLQASLGKTEARDAFEETKKNFGKYVHDAKDQIDEAAETTMEKAMELKGTLEHLRVQLALGTAEAKESIEEQMKKIKHAISKFEDTVMGKG